MAEAKFSYEIISKEKKTIRIKQAQSVTEEVVIPEKVVYYKQEYTVTEIGYGAFVSQTSVYFTQLKKVIIPNSVTRIGRSAFLGCRALECIVLPDSIADIGEGAFRYCCKAEFKGSIPAENDGAIIINGTLIAPPQNVSTYNIPKGVTRIGDYAFSDCIGLTAITIPKGVVSIGEDAFFNCSSLTTITIPSSVTSIGRGAFAWCSGLIDIDVAEGNTTYDSRGGCNAIIETNSNTLIAGFSISIIPPSVTKIGVSAFLGCPSLTRISIPPSVTEIGYFAFLHCHNLTTITLPENMTSIDGEAFACCSLQSIIIPKNKEAIMKLLPEKLRALVK